MTSGQGNQSQATNSGAGTEWPRQVDFTQALQHPNVSLIGDSVKGSDVIKLASRQPIIWSGSFASVYKITKDGADHVIRCFMRPVTDQKDRYTNLSNFLNSSRPEFLVRFEYLDEGILVKGLRYPLVKMDFVEGEKLNTFVKRVIEDQQNHAGILSRVANSWKSVNNELRNLRIAHNDLQHGNVIIQNDLEIRLVDYDSFYLWNSSKGNTPEGGHRHYQHPLRKQTDYNEHVDNFPALVIYLSLMALDSEPNLWRFNQGDYLLFTDQDFLSPSSSEIFHELKRSRIDRVCRLTNYLEQYCSVPVEQVPNLSRITSAENAGQTDAPLEQATSNVQISQPSAGQAGSSAAQPPGPTAGQSGQPQAPGGQVQGAPSVQPSPPSAGQSVSPVSRPPAGQRGQPQAPGGQVRPPQSGRVNPASAAGMRPRMQTPIPTAQQSPPTPAPAAPVLAQPPSPSPVAAVQAMSIVKCSSGHINDIGLIYCQEEQCADIMQPGTQGCADCQYIHPANANFCPQCSRKLK